MKRLLLVILALMILTVSACSVKDAARTYVIEPSETAAPQPTPEPTPQPTQAVPDMDFSKIFGAYDTEMVLAEPTLYEWTEDVYFPVKPPKVGEYDGKGYYDVDDVAWSGINEEDYAEFCESLKEQGWRAVREGEMWGAFLKENDLIYLEDQSFVEEGKRSKNNFFTISWDKGCKTPCADGRVSARRAAQIIWPRIYEALEENEKSEIVEVIELEDDELFKKLGMQAFKAYTKNNYGYSFLVKGDEAELFMQSDYPPVFADIDGDGVEEYLTLTGWGSGIYRYFFNAYGKNVEPKYQCVYYPSEKSNFRWKVEKMDDGAHLVGVDFETGKTVANLGLIMPQGDGLTAQGIGEYISEWG